MNSASSINVFFARYPLTAQVKTRLGYSLGYEASANLYKKILNKVITSFKANNSIEVFASLAPIKLISTQTNVNKSKEILEKNALSFFENFGIAKKNIYWQKGSDLGARLADTFLQLKNKNLRCPLIISGTDYPAYTPNLALEATQLLKKYDAVLGPAIDGGYYLIALNSKVYHDSDLINEAFNKLSWSHERVMLNQKERLESLGLRVSTDLAIIQDIDDFDDLCQYQKKQKEKQTKQRDLKQKQSDTYQLCFDEFIPDIRVVLPVLNEAKNLPVILERLQKSGYFSEIICADNGSTDGSVSIAEKMGAIVSHCKKKGYGATCLKALEGIAERKSCDIVLFLDADGSDDLDAMKDILANVISSRFEFCLGQRSPQLAESGALYPHARFGNWLATYLIAIFWGFSYKDLGPFRAIRWEALDKLKMDDMDFGWTVQMQIRAVKQKLKIIEVPVAYRKRQSGKSKVSASVLGSLKAGYIILKVVFSEFFFHNKLKKKKQLNLYNFI